jgi:signal transduction histidine kinase
MTMNHGGRVTTLVVVVLLLTVLCGLGALFTAREMERLMGTMVSRNLPSLQAASELRNALQRQRGLVAAYMLDDGRLAWVNDLDLIKPSLERSLVEAKRAARTDEERRILGTLDQVYRSYDQERDKAIALYHDGRRAEARDLLLGDVSRLSDEAYDLCRQLVDANGRYMNDSLHQGHQRVRSLALSLAVGIGLALLLSATLILVVFRSLLLPVRRLAKDARAHTDHPTAERKEPFANELHELEYYSRTLMSDMTRTRTDLAESERLLLGAEKLAAVGKFAACAAHEIRSPLTSIRMWLYHLKQPGTSREEVQSSCRVLEEEVGRLEELATSFLQFSRPPSLHLAPEDVNTVIDGTLELVRERLHDKRLRLRRINGTVLPPIMADAHQLRQVLLNLIANAADASPEGGEVRIVESSGPGPDGRNEVLLRIEDDGPGVSETVRKRLFEPFVTTKPNGTGLGLAVSSSIMQNHGGRLALESEDRPGATFAVHIPACGE